MMEVFSDTKYTVACGIVDDIEDCKNQLQIWVIDNDSKKRIYKTTITYKRNFVRTLLAVLWSMRNVLYKTEIKAIDKPILKVIEGD